MNRRTRVSTSSAATDRQPHWQAPPRGRQRGRGKEEAKRQAPLNAFVAEVLQQQQQQQQRQGCVAPVGRGQGPKERVGEELWVDGAAWRGVDRAGDRGGGGEGGRRERCTCSSSGSPTARTRAVAWAVAASLISPITRSIVVLSFSTLHTASLCDLYARLQHLFHQPALARLKHALLTPYSPHTLLTP